MKKPHLNIVNAYENNLKNISVKLPKNKLVVVTGVSGSGKSSLVFDTIFKEGQRRYIASLSSYARQFIQNIEQPLVDIIDGLSPTICIDQKSVGRNPRSTVGTITEVYDFLRLLFSRLGTPHCPNGHGPIETQTVKNILEQLFTSKKNKIILIMAPLIIDRKGEYRRELEKYYQQGFTRMLINNKIHFLNKAPELNRYEKHTLELVIDRVVIEGSNKTRISEAIYKAVAITNGKASFLDWDSIKDNVAKKNFRKKKEQYFLSNIYSACKVCGTSVKELEPKLFSFNSPADACKNCQGLGYLNDFNPEYFIKDKEKFIFDGALHVLNKKGNVLFSKKGKKEITQLFKKTKIPLSTPWANLPKNFKNKILYDVLDKKSGFSIKRRMEFLYQKYRITLFEKYMQQVSCEKCLGTGLNEIALNVTLAGKKIYQLNSLAIKDLLTFFEKANPHRYQPEVWLPIVKEINQRLKFLVKVGVDYLALNRKANTLSGGESQRIRLASQIGKGLEGCLYIFDEPSIGLHQIDNQKLISTLQVLRDQGNSLIVIEHDEETMLAADHLIEIGPLAGEKGGQVIFSSSPLEITQVAIKDKTKNYSTIDYLIGKKNIPFVQDLKPLQHEPWQEWIRFEGISKFNLKNLTVEIPLNQITVFTGVSGSGKSTLFDVIEQAWLEKNRKQLYQNLKLVVNFKKIEKLVIVNQKPIGKTLRSNPATYTGIWTHIRDLFTCLEESRIRNYLKGRFSFNVKGGRCEECAGSGIKRVELHLFSPIDITCENCLGKRFNNATLEILYENKNIFNILEMTVEEALEFFQAIPKLKKGLQLLNDIGLGYIKLGHPSPTLSGGEAQRIKLVTELIKGNRGKTFFLLDEPTTGLHFKDIANFLKILNKLKEEKNTILIIEHNLEIIKSADYLIELGPHGGEKGGKIISQGNVREILQEKTPTGKVLKEYYQRQRKKEKKHFFTLKNINQLFLTPYHSSKSPLPQQLKKNKNKIIIEGLKKHNLKNISLSIYKNEITVFTGVSGSGKSSIAIDSIFAEGQRRYLESLSTYARRFLGRIPRIEADKIENLTPTICIDQKGKTNNPRSTLGTQTEIYDHLRVLYAGISLPHCPSCNDPLQRFSPKTICSQVLQDKKWLNQNITVLSPLYRQNRADFFFIKYLKNLENYFKLYQKKGFFRFFINQELVNLNNQPNFKAKPTHLKKIDLVIDRINLNEKNIIRLQESLEMGFQLGNGVVHLELENQIKSYSQFYSCQKDNYFLLEEITPRHFSFNHHLTSCLQCQGTGQHYGVAEKLLIKNYQLPFLNGALDLKISSLLLKLKSLKPLIDEAHQKEIDLFNTPFYQLTPEQKNYILYGDFVSNWRGLSKLIKSTLEDFSFKKYYSQLFLIMQETTCDECKGGRLKDQMLKFKIKQENIFQLTTKKVEELFVFIQQLDQQLNYFEKKVAENPLKEICFRLKKLNELGLGYLSLDRKISTLSGGEMQRIRLANQIGNKLKDVIYVLDEPTMGLHERDTAKLIKVIQDLKKNQNTVLLVEHDATIIKAADNIVDVGPQAGELGGQVIYQGKNQKSKISATSVYPYLHQKKKMVYREKNKISFNHEPYFKTGRIFENNLKGIKIKLPLQKLIGISGVSGSGKSSLVNWLHHHILKLIQLGSPQPIVYENVLKSPFRIKEVCFISQNSITLNKRSTVVTYMGIYDLIRDIFALTHEAKANGFDKGYFSFNSTKGGCLKCQGLGVEEIEMHFISNVSVVCEECLGKRFKKEVLDIYYQEKNIHEVLEMTFNQALDFFHQFKLLREKITRLIKAGLGYLKLGYKTSNLSGGELQRLKIAYELAFANPSSTLYILDEPTTGLHFKDIEIFVSLLEEILQEKGTIIVIEHNIEFLRSVDYLIDLGPEGGERGGELLAMATPQEVAQTQGSHTAKFL